MSKVLMLDNELDSVTAADRIQQITTAMRIEFKPGQFKYISLMGLLAEGVDYAIKEVLKIIKKFGIEVVIIDPIYNLNIEGDENSSRDQTRFLNKLNILVLKGKVSLILVDHFSKGPQAEKEPLDALRGSSVKGGFVDACLIIRQHEEKDCFRVDHICRQLASADPFVMKWQYPIHILMPQLDPQDMLRATKGGRPSSLPPTDILLRSIAGSDVKNPITISAWATQLSLERSGLSKNAKLLESQGLIASIGNGTKRRVFITADGLALVNNPSIQNT